MTEEIEVAVAEQTSEKQKFDFNNFDWGGSLNALTGLGFGIADRVTGYGDSTITTPALPLVGGPSFQDIYQNPAVVNPVSINYPAQPVQVPVKAPANNKMFVIAGVVGVVLVGVVLVIALKK